MKLPNSISPAFIEWLDRGGHKIELKKNAMIVKKQFSDGVKRSVIPFERHEIKEFYELDEYLSQRYELFSKAIFQQWERFYSGFAFSYGE